MTGGGGVMTTSAAWRHLQHSQTPDPLAGLLVLIELFSLGVMVDAQRANIGAKSAISIQRRPVDAKFQVEGVAPDQPFLF